MIHRWLRLTTSADASRPSNLEWSLNRALLTARLTVETEDVAGGVFVTRAKSLVRLPIKKEMNYSGEAVASADPKISFSSIREKPSTGDGLREWKVDGPVILRKVGEDWQERATIRETKETTHSVFHIVEALRQSFSPEVDEYRALCFLGSKFAMLKLVKIPKTANDPRAIGFHGFAMRHDEPFTSDMWPSLHWSQADLFELKIALSDQVIESVSFSVPLFGLLTAQRSTGG